MIETGDWEEEEGVMKVIGKKDHKQAEALLDRMEDRVNRLKELNERLTKNLGAKETVEKTIHFSSLSNIELLETAKARSGRDVPNFRWLGTSHVRH